MKIIIFSAPSGTGKSTLLRIIAGLEEPSAGRVTYAGQPLERGSVGVVFQRPILYPHLSVKDNILFPTRLGAFAGRVDMDYECVSMEPFIFSGNILFQTALNFLYMGENSKKKRGIADLLFFGKMLENRQENS